MALTVMPAAPTSLASVRVKQMTPAWAAEKLPPRGRPPPVTFIDEVLTMRPKPLARNAGSANLLHRKLLRRWVCTMMSQSSIGISWTLRPRCWPPAPALLTGVASPIICRSALAIEAHRGVASLANTLGIGCARRLALRSDGCAQPTTSDRGRGTSSVQRYLIGPKPLAPTRSFGSSQFLEVLRCASQGVKAKLREALEHYGVGEGLVQLLIQSHHHGSWQARRPEKALECEDLCIGHPAFSKSGYVRQQR